MKNIHRDDYSPVEMIEGRPKRLRTNEIDGRERVRLREEKGWEGRKTKATRKGKSTNILKIKTPVEIIEEREKRLHTSRMDTRLRTLVPRRRTGRAGEKKQLRIELKDEEARVDLTRNAPDEKS